MSPTRRPSLLLLLVASLLFLSTPALGQFFNFFNQQGGQAREQEPPHVSNIHCSHRESGNRIEGDSIA